MSAPVEAQSLSSLTHLLANPPQYPRNPTHETHEPLTLYIVRVPGSQDVFLTPIKPPTKTCVSLDAINSSLYYFHVETREDVAARRSVDQSRRTSEESQRSVQSIARKPLPAGAHAPSPPPHIHLPQSRVGTVRATSYRDSSIDDTTQPHLDATHHGSPFRPTHGAPAPSAAYPNSMQYRSPYTQDTSSSRGLKLRLSATYSRMPKITMIRRDPSSGVQWNIGTISQLQPTFSGSTVKPLEIQLDTPGYSRFKRHPETPRPGSAGSDAVSIRRAMADALAESHTVARDDDELRAPFSRVVDFRNMAAVDLDRHVYQRTNSFGSSTITDAAKMLSQKHVLQFTSPWNGTCSFINAIDGRALRLQHTVHSTTPTSESVTNKIAELRFNLFPNVFNNRSYRSTTDREEEYLPVSELVRTKKQKFRRSLHDLRHHSWEGRRSKHQPSFAPAHDPLRNLTNIQTPTTNNLYTPDTASSHSSLHEAPAADQTTEGRISLRLGREHAGGGFRGQSAKLGKLIIEDEGLKMCDLVVAACMGVWWQHYDKIEDGTS